MAYGLTNAKGASEEESFLNLVYSHTADAFVKYTADKAYETLLLLYVSTNYITISSAPTTTSGTLTKIIDGVNVKGYLLKNIESGGVVTQLKASSYSDSTVMVVELKANNITLIDTVESISNLASSRDSYSYTFSTDIKKMLFIRSVKGGRLHDATIGYPITLDSSYQKVLNNYVSTVTMDDKKINCEIQIGDGSDIGIVSLCCCTKKNIKTNDVLIWEGEGCFAEIINPRGALNGDRLYSYTYILSLT